MRRRRVSSHVRADRASVRRLRSQPASSLDSRRGLLLGVRPRVRPGRGLHAAGGDRRPGGQRRARCSRRPGRCHDEGVAVAVFPELCLTGYAIDDLLLQDTLLDAVEAAIATVVAASRRPAAGARRRRAAGARHPGAQLRGRHPPRPGPRRRAEVLPADLPRVLRAPLVRAGRRPARRARSRSAGRRCRSGPTCSSRATDVPGLELHVEICEDMWVPVPPSAEAALAGATVLANLSGSPITVARAEDRRLLVRSASARCHAAYLYAAAGPGRVDAPTCRWDGQTMVYECGDLLAESERFPDGPRRTVADVDLDRIRQERLRQGTFDDNRRTHDDRIARRSATVEFDARRRRPATSGCGARSTASRSCPTTPSGSRWTATRPTTSRSPGSSSGCTRSASPRSSSASAAASTRPTR